MYKIIIYKTIIIIYKLIFSQKLQVLKAPLF